MEINTAIAIGILFIFIICCLIGCIIAYKKIAQDKNKNFWRALKERDYARYERDLTKDKLEKANNRIEFLEC